MVLLFACLFAFGLLSESGHAQRVAKTMDEAIMEVSDQRMMERTMGDEVVDGLDMVLSKEQYDGLYGKSQGRLLAKPVITPWTDGIVPYVIEPAYFEDHHLKKIEQGMRQWEALTCLKFKKAEGEHNVTIYSASNGCWAHLGMNPGTNQRLSLNAGGCFWRGTVEHELGHAIGLVHEHQRPNRDDHLVVVPEHVQHAYKSQVAKYAPTLTKHGLGYDYYSVMHYGHYAFTYDQSKATIYAFSKRQNKYLSHLDKVIGKVLGPSFTDAKLVNIMYKCADHCSNKNSCPADCYMDKNCECVCERKMPALLCEDNRGNCSSMDEKFCMTQRFDNEIFCRKRCGLCAEEGSTLPPEMPNVKCQDYENDCGSWKEMGECTAIEDYMNHHCRATCGKCTPE